MPVLQVTIVSGALPTPERVALAYLRLLGPEGKVAGSAPLGIVT